MTDFDPSIRPYLVTGATGHTGRRLVQSLLESGKPVRILSRQPARLPLELRQQCQVVRGSLENPEDARNAVSGCAAVLALTHIKLAHHILAAMHATGVRRGIFTSSTRRFTRWPEETARQVIAGEEAVRTSGLDYTILRCSMIYGGRQDKNLERLVQALRRWPIFPLVGGGSMKWQPVFTWDVIAAIHAALDRPVAIQREYTLAGPEPITYREMLRTICREGGLTRILVPVPLFLVRWAVKAVSMVIPRPPVTLDQIQRLEEDKVFDISEAVSELGFAPVSFAEGIRRKLAGKA